MSQIASRAAGLMAAPLPLPVSMVAGDPATGTLALVAVPAATPHPRTVAVPACAGTAATTAATVATAVVNGEPSASPAGDATAVPATTSSPAATGAAAAPATTTFSTRPAATATTTAQLGTATAFPAPATATATASGGFGGAVTALVVVIALIFALAWLAKRMPVLGGGAAGNASLRIVGSLALGPRERVIVIAVGDTQLLLGVGAGGTRTLHTLSEPLPVATSTTPAFAQLLAQHFGKKA